MNIFVLPNNWHAWLFPTDRAWGSATPTVGGPHKRGSVCPPSPPPLPRAPSTKTFPQATTTSALVSTPLLISYYFYFIIYLLHHYLGLFFFLNTFCIYLYILLYIFYTSFLVLFFSSDESRTLGYYLRYTFFQHFS